MKIDDTKDYIKKKSTKRIKAKKNGYPEQQMFFGGMPIGGIKKVPMVKVVDKYPKIKKKKQFDFNKFL